MNLICVSQSHFDLEYYGGPGIKVTPIMEGDKASVEVEVFTNGMKEGQYFQYTLIDAEGNAVANAGELTDEGWIHKVSKPNPDYILKEKGAVLNWWDIVEIEGYASLNTKLRILNEKLGLAGTAKLLIPIMGPRFAEHPQFLGQLDSFSVLRMLNRITGAMGMQVTKEQLLALNEDLNKVAI